MTTSQDQAIQLELMDLLRFAVTQQASDLHISPNQPPILRVDGDLVPLPELPRLNAEMTKRMAYSLLDKAQQEAFETRFELDLGLVIPNVGTFRANLFHQLHGVAGVFRVISETIPPIDEIGASAGSVIKELLELSSGLILLTGPTGCGKSTTLASMIEHINTHQQLHIITLEDPIEFIHQSKECLIQQRQIYRDSGSFANALRASLREDPDVILVGEMRDLETIRLALTAAETGHLVLATLHTSSAPRAISRVIDVFPTGEKNIIRNLISESLQAVICQTLVKRREGGRIAAFEIMLGTPAIRNLIREDKIAQMYSVIQTSGRLGMCTMEQSMQSMIDKGMITSESKQLSGFQRELFEKL